MFTNGYLKVSKMNGLRKNDMTPIWFSSKNLRLNFLTTLEVEYLLKPSYSP